jgi:predicted acetyltransferase
VTQTYPVRVIGPEQFAAFFAVGMQAFNADMPMDAARELELVTFEFDRSGAAFDGDQIVGTSCAYTFQLSVPGGSVPTAGISAVSVLPTYRRRGIMSAMMRYQLADSADRGEPVAALFASEPEIYGRFGFGCASEHLRLTIRRGDGRLIPPALGTAEPPRLRVAEPGKLHGELGAVYEAVRAATPGLPERDERWWRAATADPEFGREGASPKMCLIAEDDSGPRGYALYSVKPNWDDGIPDGQLRLHELMTTDPQTTAAIWTDLLTRDLVGEVTAWLRPVDDTVLQLLAGRRRARASLSDGLWIRLIDVPAALGQRSYARDLDIVIEVIDELLPGNAGRWHLQAAGSGQVACERTSGAADVILPVQALGAAYLGGTRLGALAAAGQIAQERPGAVAMLSAAMVWDPAPWCPMIF